MPKVSLPKPVEFEKESEEVFFNTPIDLHPDPSHSGSEKRYVTYGHTDNTKKLTIIFTLRGQKIRIISARPMSHKERRQHEKN